MISTNVASSTAIPLAVGTPRLDCRKTPRNAFLVDSHHGVPVGRVYLDQIACSQSVGGRLVVKSVRTPSGQQFPIHCKSLT